MTGLTKRGVATLVTALVIGLLANLHAQQAKPKAETTVAGKWTIAVANDQVPISAGLTLAQHGTKVTGTFTSDHTGEAPVEGEFANGTLTFFITVHADGGNAMQVDFTARLKDDGSLAGTLKGPMGEMNWTGTRTK
ncbi:MAG TPA: hypothetical protein VJN96_23430 [Vicinamibacterales bacterium]|nr:hypothetical protein [Vicinamibacterales bacterium]